MDERQRDHWGCAERRGPRCRGRRASAPPAWRAAPGFAQGATAGGFGIRTNSGNLIGTGGGFGIRTNAGNIIGAGGDFGIRTNGGNIIGSGGALDQGRVGGLSGGAYGRIAYGDAERQRKAEAEKGKTDPTELLEKLVTNSDKQTRNSDDLLTVWRGGN